MKKIFTFVLSLMLVLVLTGCDKTIIEKAIEETPDREFDVSDDIIMVVLTRKEDTTIHDFYIYEDDVEISFSKVEGHNYYNWIERTEDVTDKYFTKTVYNKGDKGTFVCEASENADVFPKYVLDVRSRKDGSYNYWLSSIFHGDYGEEGPDRTLDIVDYLVKSEEDSIPEEFENRVYSIRKAVAISRYIFGDLWGLAETGGAAAGGDIESDGRLYWKAVAWGIYETGDAVFLDEKGKEVDYYNDDHSKIRSLVVDGDTLDEVRKAMFVLRNWPADLDGSLTKLSKDRYELVFDPTYLDYYAYESNNYHEVDNEVKYEFEVGVESKDESHEWTPMTYVIINTKFDIDNECEDFYDFYKTKRFPFTVVEAELSNSVG